MDKETAQSEIIRISNDFNKILQFEDNFNKFKGLSDLAQETGSNTIIPKFFKDRILKRIEEHQQGIVGLISITSELSDNESN
jgi:hypothetical protein